MRIRAKQTGFSSRLPRQLVKVTSRGKRTSGRKSLTYTKEGWPLVRKGNPIFRPKSITWYTNERGMPAVRVVAEPTNYEKKIAFHRQLATSPSIRGEVAQLARQYHELRLRGKGTITIPPHMPVTIGTVALLSIGGKYLLFPLRSEKVRAFPGKYSFVGGVPFSPNPRQASNELLRGNVREELEAELGMRGKKVKLGQPLDVHFSFRPEGMGLNIIQPVRFETNDPDGYIRRHFVPIDPHDPAKGYQSRVETREGWEATHFVLIPNTPEGLQRFYRQNLGKMTPVLSDVLQTLLRKE